MAGRAQEFRRAGRVPLGAGGRIDIFHFPIDSRVETALRWYAALRGALRH